VSASKLPGFDPIFPSSLGSRSCCSSAFRPLRVQAFLACDSRERVAVETAGGRVPRGSPGLPAPRSGAPLPLRRLQHLAPGAPLAPGARSVSEPRISAISLSDTSRTPAFRGLYRQAVTRALWVHSPQRCGPPSGISVRIVSENPSGKQRTGSEIGEA
jgi:hypothetical protein